MIEIQQLIVKAKVNDGEFEDQNIVQSIQNIVKQHLQSSDLLVEEDKQLIIDECVRTILEKIENKLRL